MQLTLQNCFLYCHQCVQTYEVFQEAKVHNVYKRSARWKRPWFLRNQKTLMLRQHCQEYLQSGWFYTLWNLSVIRLFRNVVTRFLLRVWPLTTYFELKHNTSRECAYFQLSCSSSVLSHWLPDRGMFYFRRILHKVVWVKGQRNFKNIRSPTITNELYGSDQISNTERVSKVIYFCMKTQAFENKRGVFFFIKKIKIYTEHYGLLTK